MTYADMPQDFATPELSLLVPAFNESEIILRNLTELRDWLKKNMPDLDYEILVVDDGSTDGMGDLVDSYAQEHARVRVTHHKRNMGRGKAIRTGFDESLGKVVICLDADLSYAPSHIPALLEPLQNGTADISLASAYAPGGGVENVPTSRALMSKWGNKILSASLNGQFATVTCVVRGYTREAINAMELINDGKDLHLEILQKARLGNLKIVEVPALLKWRDRDRGKAAKKGFIASLPFVSMSSTMASHLVYNWLLRPGLILFVPTVLLSSVIFVGLVILLKNFLTIYIWGGMGVEAFSFYESLRETLINGYLTLFLVFISSVILFIFMVFYFISQQNRKNFEENYVLLSRISARLKDLEDK